MMGAVPVNKETIYGIWHFEIITIIPGSFYTAILLDL